MGKLRLLMIAAFAVMGLLSSASSTFAQEAAGNDGGTATIEIETYVCEDASRAPAVDFFVAAVVPAEVGVCRLSNAEHEFSLLDVVGGVIDSAIASETGFVQFEAGAPATYSVTENNTNVSSGTFDVVAGSLATLTFVEYTLGESSPEVEGGTSFFNVQHYICEDATQAGTTDFLIGNSIVQGADEANPCEFGVGSVFTLTPAVDSSSVQAAGVGPIQLTTTDTGMTPDEVIPAGTYTLTENSNGRTSDEFVVIGNNGVIATVVDYVVPAGPPADGEASLTIHKSVCETGVGADIFESCHDDGVAGVSFWVNDVEWTTDEDGVIAGTVDSGDVVIAEDEETFDDYLGGYVYCSEQGSGDVLIDTDTQDGVIELEVADGDEVICDWYNIKAATTAPGGDDDDDEDDDKDPVTQLPATGAGVTATESGSLALLAGLIGLASVAGLATLRTRRG